MSHTAAAASDGTALTGARAGVDKAFAGLLALFLLAVLVQIFLAGLGVVDLDGSGLEEAASLDPHRILGSRWESPPCSCC